MYLSRRTSSTAMSRRTLSGAVSTGYCRPTGAKPIPTPALTSSRNSSQYWELFLELVSAGVGIGFAPVGLQYPVLTAPDSVLRLIAVEDVRLERYIYLILPSVGETSPAARRFADQLLRIHPAGT